MPPPHMVEVGGISNGRQNTDNDDRDHYLDQRKAFTVTAHCGAHGVSSSSASSWLPPDLMALASSGGSCIQRWRRRCERIGSPSPTGSVPMMTMSSPSSLMSRDGVGGGVDCCKLRRRLSGASVSVSARGA